MKTYLRSVLNVAIGGLLISSSAGAATSTICDSFRTAGQERKLANCERIVSRGLVPNRDALRYTINYLNDNHNGLRDAKCAVDGIVPNDRCIACRSREWVEKGIENDCSFVINDLTPKGKWKREPAPNRSTAYYVDLCSEDPSKVVTTFYVNGGTGPRFSDDPDRGETTDKWNKSTLAGAFMVEGRVYDDFVPGREASYARIRSNHDGRIPALRMIGLNSSNNTTESSKPMHVSPFRTSWGCSGVADSTAPVFDKIAARGSSLYMSYAGQKYEQKGTSCANDNSDAGRTGSPSGASGSTSTDGIIAPANTGGGNR